MKLKYWECKYNDYDEQWDGENETRHYGCSHPDNEEKWCDKKNKWCDAEDECELAEKKK